MIYVYYDDYKNKVNASALNFDFISACEALHGGGDLTVDEIGSVFEDVFSVDPAAVEKLFYQQLGEYKCSQCS